MLLVRKRKMTVLKWTMVNAYTVIVLKTFTIVATEKNIYVGSSHMFTETNFTNA